MDALSELWRKLKFFFRRGQFDRDLEEEMQHHVAMKAEAHLTRQEGVSSGEARNAAQREFGNTLLLREKSRNIWGFIWLETLVQDLRYGLRMLRKSPGFTAVAVVSLALGIGGTVAVFSLMYGLLFKPLPVFQPSRLVEVCRSTGEVNLHSYAVWKALRDDQDVFSGLLAYYPWDERYDVARGGESRKVAGLFVSGGFFQTLGVPAFLGRTLAPTDDRPGAAPVCMVGYGLWLRQYGQSRSILGRTVVVDGHPCQVIGVTPKSFFGVEVGKRAELFMPLEMRRIFRNQRWPNGVSMPTLDASNGLSIIGRLKTEISVSQADARLRVLGTDIYKSLPPAESPSDTLNARVLPGGMPRSYNGISPSYSRYISDTLLLMVVMAGVVLVIVCANLANLLLARATKRQGEIATRLALGATPRRLARQLLTESAVLSLAGTAGGLAFAYWTSEALLPVISLPGDSLVLDFSWDTKLVAVTIGVTLLSVLLFGLAPAIRATRISLYSGMNSGATLGKRSGRFSNSVLVVSQVALSMAILIGAGLLVRTLHALLAKSPGYEAKGVLVAQVNVGAGNESSQREAFEGKELLREFRSVPGVISASWLANFSRSTLPEVSIPQPRGTLLHARGYRFFVSSDFFKTRRSPMLAGRDFNVSDNETATPVAILSWQAARTFFRGVNPVGLSFQENDFGNSGQTYSVRVVGIVKDMDFQAPQDAALPIFFRPVSQCSACLPMGRYEIRFAGPLSGMTERLRNVAARVDSNLASRFHPLTDEINASVQRNRAAALMATLFSLFVGLLATIGVYGVSSYATAERTHEIGIRMALGAQPGNVLRMIIRESLSAVFVGMIFGVLGGYGAAQTIRGTLWGITPTDPLTYTSAAGLMLLVAGIAAFLPARRAMRIDPMVCLRYE